MEKDTQKYPTTLNILSKFPNANVIEIDNYKHVFNRPNQNFQAQKQSPKLILALKKDNFFYKGSDVVNNYGFSEFYYNTLILNCVYNCEYCYLQGMFNSGNIVVFVNIEDYFSETRKLIADKKVYLCISYETDLLAFEELVPYTRQWIEFSKEFPNLSLEVRTKSNKYKEIMDLAVNKNVILAWTISPNEIIADNESKTPTLNRRLQDIKKAAEDGWNVRICFDPILHIKGWKEIYRNLVLKTFSDISPEQIYDISLGTFRINADYLKKMKRLRTDSAILYYPYEREGKLYKYSKTKIEEIMFYMVETIAEFYDSNKIFPTM